VEAPSSEARKRAGVAWFIKRVYARFHYKDRVQLGSLGQQLSYTRNIVIRYDGFKQLAMQRLPPHIFSPIKRGFEPPDINPRL
jgi:hypothetical protein